MRRLSFLLLVMLICCTIHAANYDYLVFKQADGTETALSASKMKITFSNGNAVITASDGVLTTLLLKDLNAMYFSDNGATGIKTATTNGEVERASVYSLTGVKMAEGVDVNTLEVSLKPGVYLVKTNTRTFKIQIK